MANKQIQFLRNKNVAQSYDDAVNIINNLVSDIEDGSPIIVRFNDNDEKSPSFRDGDESLPLFFTKILFFS